MTKAWKRQVSSSHLCSDSGSINDRRKIAGFVYGRSNYKRKKSGDLPNRPLAVRRESTRVSCRYRAPFERSCLVRAEQKKRTTATNDKPQFFSAYIARMPQTDLWGHRCGIRRGANLPDQPSVTADGTEGTSQKLSLSANCHCVRKTAPSAKPIKKLINV